MGIIAGVYTQKNDPSLKGKLNSMITCQLHRDNSRPITHIKENLAFGMVNRHDLLYTENINNFKQISQKNSDSHIHAFVDGIILNIPKHLKYFDQIGISIIEHSGSAIVAAAYQKWGLDFMNHLEGEFSCVVLDEQSKKVILARDPYGHKPLHYYFKNNRLIFSSEIKGILAEGISPEIDLINLSDLLTFGRVPNPATIFKNIFQVSPGNIVVISTNNIDKHVYWDHKIAVDKTLSFDDAILQLTDSLRSAVKKRIVTDNVYCFLSGGIDSSALVSIASEVSDKPIHAISIGFEEDEYNELGDAALMAKHIGVKLHMEIARPDSFFNMLDTMIWHHDIPFYDTSAYPTYYAAKLARRFTDVILTGDGPDQTMGGSEQEMAVKKSRFSERTRFIQML